MGITMGTFVLWFVYINKAVDESIWFHPQSNLSKYCTKYFSQFVRYKQDVFVLNTIIIEGILLPILFFIIMYISRYYTLPFYAHFTIWYLYSFLRIGPASMHFAYFHTLVHKEGHTRLGLFKFENKIINTFCNNAFNWWIGLFYGVMPGTYAYGHSIGHHGFNNLEGDLISTGWAPRDSMINWFAYLIQMALYSLNVTTIYSFYYGRKGLQQYVIKMIYGQIWYWAFYFLCYIISGYNTMFVIFYLTYPQLEGLVFLSGINWSWHLFVDPDDFGNDYVASLTLFNGPSNVLNEDYHVVHHQYPAHHWTKHPKLFEKHKSEYYKNNASVFQGTHAMELWYFAITKQYEMIYNRYDKTFLPKSMTKEDVIELLKKRMRATFFDKNGNFKPKYKIQTGTAMTKEN